MLDKLSHLPSGAGSLQPTSGLGGNAGAGVHGEYLARRGVVEEMMGW